MCQKSESLYQKKLNELKYQHQLYDDFLVKERPQAQEREKLLQEIDRISMLINKLAIAIHNIDYDLVLITDFITLESAINKMPFGTDFDDSIDNN